MMSNTMMLESTAMVPSADDLIRMFPELADLSDDELQLIDGGADWGWIGSGIVAYGGATIAILSLSNPITAGIGAAYLLTCAGSGLMIAWGATR